MSVRKTEFGTTATSVSLGHPPCRSFTTFFILPLGTAVKHTLINIYIYMYVFITVMKNLCRYTPEPRAPNRCELRPCGLG
jgi:hypothetical protein